MVSTDKRGLSALGLSKRLGLSYWKAWTILQKIRLAMRDRDSTYKLAGIIEIDDSFFGSPVQGNSKRGRGSSKTAVVVKAYTNGDTMGFAKMSVVDKLNGETISKLVKTGIIEHQRVKTDGLPVYSIVGKSGHTHHKEIIKGKKAHDILKWTHILISNAK